MSKPIFMPMNFRDGTGGRKMRPEFADKCTIDLVISGDRTATSRSLKAQKGIKKGDTIKFYATTTQSFRSVIVEATTDEYDLSQVTAEEWSKLECWVPEMYEDLRKKGYKQFQFVFKRIIIEDY